MRILLAGVLGGIMMFVWTSIAHMALPLREAGIDEIPNESSSAYCDAEQYRREDRPLCFPGSSIAAHAVVEHHVGTIRKLTNASVNGHIYVNSLIRNHFEWLRFRADVTLRHASMHIEDVIARSERDAVFSVFVHR